MSVQPIKVFVSTSPNYMDLSMVKAYLTALGYEVRTRKDAKVEDCDVFFGLITPDLGKDADSDSNGGSITYAEMKRAYDKKMPHYMMANYRVMFAHSLCRELENDEKKKHGWFGKKIYNVKKRLGIKISQPNRVIDTSLVSEWSVKAHRFATLDTIKCMSKRKGNWVQEYKDVDDVKTFIQAQFTDSNRIANIIH